VAHLYCWVCAFVVVGMAFALLVMWSMQCTVTYRDVFTSSHKGLSVKGLAVGKGTGMLCCGHSSCKVGSSGSSTSNICSA
jgi:hypothetical protein